MRLSFLFIVLLFCSMPASAQFMDTLHAAFTGHKSFDFRYESRNSFVNNERVEVQSLKMGVTFGKKISAGGGFSWLKTKMYDDFKIHDAALGRDTIIQRNVKLKYLCYYVDYIFYKSKRWQYSIPTQFGTGYSEFSYNYRDQGIQTSRYFIFLYEPGVNIKYKIFTWLGVGANVGYRLAFKNNKYLNKRLNSPIYSAGVIIYWDQLALAIFPKNKLVNKYLGPVEW